MKKRPLVSIIIPTYNHAQFLPDAVESVLSQTYSNWECIIVDDGSTDNTEEIVQNYLNRDTRIKYLSLTRNRGLSAARNVGIKESEGKYLVFLDADDYISPTKIEKEVKVLENHPEVGWVYEKSLIIDEKSKQVIQRLPEMALKPNEKPPEGRIFYKLLGRNLMPVNAVMIEKKIVESVGLFDESLKSYEDWDLWLRVAVKYDIKFLNDTLAFVRFRPHSMQRDFITFYSNRIKVIRKICKMYPDLASRYKHVIRKTLAQTHYHLGAEYCNKRRTKDSMLEFIRAIKLNPFQKMAYISLIRAFLKEVFKDSQNFLLF